SGIATLPSNPEVLPQSPVGDQRVPPKSARPSVRRTRPFIGRERYCTCYLIIRVAAVFHCMLTWQSLGPARLLDVAGPGLLLSKKREHTKAIDVESWPKSRLVLCHCHAPLWEMQSPRGV